MKQNSKQSSKKVTDISNCRVRRLPWGMAVCLVNSNCAHALPFGNLCAHPQVAEIPDGADSRPGK
ncbi:MAG TPA: hypothetical protein VK149_01185 [Sideroxyarcus sp.]|nr:hypothetical protein [Sideroxyarcus sp.]